MTSISLRRLPRRLPAGDLLRIEACCSHALVPEEPAASGFRYVDLGGAVPPMYVRRFGLGTKSAAVTLTAPIEMTEGDEAEPGAPGLARAALTVGFRSVPWERIPDLELEPGESALLADAAVRVLAGLDLLEPGECPLCAA
ncbi:MAG: hypothetical protein ACXVYV_02750 [Gaiellales bacterium]